MDQLNENPLKSFTGTKTIHNNLFIYFFYAYLLETPGMQIF